MALSESTTKLIQDRVAGLPEGIQHLLEGSYLEDTIDDLVATYDLGSEAARQLSNEVMLVLLCFNEREKFPQKLNEILKNYDNTIIVNIHRAVEENIFSLVGSDMQDVWEFIETPEVETELPQKKEEPKLPPDNTYINTNVREKNDTEEKPDQTEPALVAQQREKLLQEIEAAEEKLASIRPIRTMESDYQQTAESETDIEPDVKSTPPTIDSKPAEVDETIHQSKQEDLLPNRQTNQSYSTLAPDKDNSVKWQSDDS